MKFKTILLQTSTIVTLSLFSSQISAENASSDTQWKPYVGMNLGCSSLSIKNTYNQKVGLTETKAKEHFSGNGGVGYLYLGVQRRFHPLLNIGGEVYGFLSQQKTKIDQDTVGDGRIESIKRNFGYGMKFKLGYFLNSQTNLYGHIGVERSKFEYRGAINVPSGLDTSGSFNFKKYKSLWGLPFGAGLETAISNQWKGRLEYTYSIYKKWETGNLITLNEVYSKLSVRQHTIVLGVAYQF